MLCYTGLGCKGAKSLEACTRCFGVGSLCGENSRAGHGRPRNDMAHYRKLFCVVARSVAALTTVKHPLGKKPLFA
jgi:hypothetical protein